MNELKRTVFYDTHVAAGATMVDFGGWEMPIQYPGGILAEHLYCRSRCGIFDVSHMGRIDISGPDRLSFVQYVLTNNAAALPVGKAQYTIIPDENGCAIDDAYLYRFEEDRFFLVINAGNIEKDLIHLNAEAKRFDVALKNISDRVSAIAVQGPDSDAILEQMSGGKPMTESKAKNALGILTLDGRPVRISRTGYTGEPIGYELYCDATDAVYFWNRLIELGAQPIALGARDTLRMEAGLPLYGHEMGECALGGEIPIFSVPLSRFAVSFAEEKGDFIGKAALQKQAAAREAVLRGENAPDLPYRIFAVALRGKGVLRAHCEVFDPETGEALGYVTSGTMIPYYVTKQDGDDVRQTEQTGRRSIGMAYLKSSVHVGDTLSVDIRGRRVEAVVVSSHLNGRKPPYAIPILAE